MDQGRISGMIAIFVALLAVSAHAKEFPARPGEYVVKLKPTISFLSTTQTETMLSGKVQEIINPRERILRVQKSVVETRQSALKTLNENPLVEYAEPNYIYRVVGTTTQSPNDPELGRLWGLINTGQRAEGDGGVIVGKAGVDVDAQRAWMMETGSRDVIVAVIDTGVNWSHPDLINNILVNDIEKDGQPGVDDDNNGCVDDIYGCDIAGKDSDPMDVFGHGTHVAGTIAASGNNGNGIVGVAYNARILPVRFLGDDGSGTLADAIKSIDYATSRKVQIMNNSWGGGGFSQALMDSIVRAKEAGILFLAAAGNSGNDNDNTPEYPASYNVDNVMAVAAIDPSGSMADFSNFGKSRVQIAAPGVNVLSYTMRGLESWSGTSMACPHAAGVAALVLSQDLSQDYLTVKQRLLSSARPMGSLRGRVSTGLVNAYYALTNQIAPADPDDPFAWMRSNDTVSTPHPYVNLNKQEFTFTVPGAKRVSVYFTKFETEAGYDKVTFFDGLGKQVGAPMSGRLGEVFGPVVEGDTIKVVFSPDDTVNAYGFDIGGVAFQN